LAQVSARQPAQAPTAVRAMAAKVAVVTGGAGGIGAAICRRLAQGGYRLVVGYNHGADRAQALAQALPGEGHAAMQAMIDDSRSLRTMASQIQDRFGTVDLLVNNAGKTTPVPHGNMDDLTDDLFDDILRTNVRGAFACTRALRTLLQGNGGGVVVNVSSIAGTTGIGSNVAYCASKAAVNNMTISLGRALAPEIRVVAVAPGWVLGEYAKKADPAYLKEQTDKTPLGRLCQGEDVAETVFAAATMMPFTTGAVIPVDGGRPFV